MLRRLHQELLQHGIICTPFSAFILSTAMTEHEIDALGDAAARCFARLRREFE
jgi:glutamate-1-semialdehyde aminotransferase